MHLILCRLIWSDGTCLRVPSSQTLCEYHQPRSEVGISLYCYTMGSDLSQPTSTLLFPTTSRFVPVLKSFYV